MRDHIRPAVVLLVLLTLLTGAFYPLAVTVLAQAIFPRQAEGSLVVEGDAVAGSALIGQPFDTPGYFWPRPSATLPFPYNAATSGGSNLGPRNPALSSLVRARVAALRNADPGNLRPVPVDLVTASGSGLDPHISVAAALYQVPRVARSRGISEARLEGLIAAVAENRQLGVLGEPRVNVLNLNLLLDRLQLTP